MKLLLLKAWGILKAIGILKIMAALAGIVLLAMALIVFAFLYCVTEEPDPDA